MIRWLGGRGTLEVIRPGAATCFASSGDPSELDFFLVSPALRQLVVGCRAYEGTSLATHLPFVLHVAVGGTVEPLTRWIRPKCPDQAVLGRICGPVQLVQDELAVILGGPEWGGVVGGPPISQVQMDAGWAAWMRQACAEIHAATGADTEKAGDPYRLLEFDPLERCRTRCKAATVAEMFRWCDRRLAEAVAAHRRGNWASWSGRYARKVAKDFVGGGAPLGHLVPIFQAPWDCAPELLAEERVRLAALMDTYLANRKALAIAKWRRELDERAEAGLREAFRFLRQDDDPDKEICSKGVGQVLSSNCAVWSKLWEVDPGLGRCRVGDEARTAVEGHQVRRIAASTWRSISASFLAGTSCPDGLHVRWFRWLSDSTLEHLSTLAAAMIARGSGLLRRPRLWSSLYPRPRVGNVPLLCTAPPSA